MAQDDAEIAALEKKLGVKGKNSKTNGDDGLDDLLDGLEESTSPDKSSKRKLAEDEEWLRQKRRRVGRGIDQDNEESSGGAEEETEEDELSVEDDDELSDALDGDSELEAVLEASDADSEVMDEGEENGDDKLVQSSGLDQSDFEDFGEDDEEDGVVETTVKSRVRENPYLPPVTTTGTTSATKYIPPSLRKANGSDDEAQKRLQRQIQGQINRLSEANMLSILQTIEQIYQSNPRQHVTSGLIDIFIASISEKASLTDTFLILHAGFIAAIYKVIGTDFGAQVVERIVSDMDRCLDDATCGKQASNLVSMLAELYNFQVIGCALIFDYIRIFIRDLSEDSTELLLRVIRMSGSQLRQDDPTALKEIVLQVQKTVAQLGQKSLSVRQSFMIETINDLKNNRMKTGVAASAVTSEHTVRMKKTLGTLKTRTLRANEPLRISLDDIRNTEKKGKWWLVGASYHDPSKMAASDEPGLKQTNAKAMLEQPTADEGTADLLQLAREQRMNTDVRRAIFISIMSATDYKDANTRLLKLSLKKTQMLEIPRVLVHCAGAEGGYNPYYTLIGRRLCEDKKLRMAFQFALWDLFKRMGERETEDEDEDDEDDEMQGEALNMRKLLNLAKMFASLVSDGALPITVLKNLNFGFLQPKTRTFLEILLTTVVVSCSGDRASGQHSLQDVVSKAHEVPEMVSGLRYFIESVVARSEIVDGKTQRKLLSSGCKVALRTLARVEGSE